MFATEVYALLLMAGFLFIGYLAVRLPLVSRVFLPGSLVAGLLLLIVSPQVAGQFFPEWQINPDFYDFWNKLPKHLINVLFACLFLARVVPPAKKMWKMAGPQAAFGQMLAWGQYAVGGILTLFVLIPLFGARDLTAALIEMSFEGGHGTVSGMAPVFEKINFQQGKDLAVGLATVSLCFALISGVILVNWGRRKGYIKTVLKSGLRERIYHRRIVHELNKNGIKLREHLSLKNLATHSVLIVISIGLGWLLYSALIIFESTIFNKDTSNAIIQYVPLFPFCMFGGMIAQQIWSRLGFSTSRPLIELMSSIALSVLITSAVATMSLSYIAAHLLTFALLAIVGIVWIVFGFIIFAPRMFKKNWFQNGIVNASQSMGMTATGLLFLHMVDPNNKTDAMESFGYKQLMFEPFMGGGIVTALSMPAIAFIGLPIFTIVTSLICLTWLLLGMFYFRRL